MSTATDADRIARRYPPSRVPRRAWVVLAVALALVGGVWLLWSASYGANPAISAKIARWDVPNDQTATATVRVQRPDPSVAATCVVVAQAESYQIVGQLPLEIAPSDTTLEDHDVTIRTIKRATTVVIESCRPR